MVFTISSSLLFKTSHAQPLPNTVAAELLNSSLKFSKDPNFSIIASLISPDNSPPSDAVPGVFRDYEYTIGGTSGFAEEFESFQFKIVMRSSNALFYPTFRDFRAIVLID